MDTIDLSVGFRPQEASVGACAKAFQVNASGDEVPRFPFLGEVGSRKTFQAIPTGAQAKESLVEGVRV